MINFIFGNQGCGKTSRIIEMIADDVKNGIRSILIVPEQEAVIAERLTLESLPSHAQLSLEVLNFSRLYNRVCREYGGLCYSYVTKPIKHVTMIRALKEISYLLTEYKNNALSDNAFVETMLATVSELKASSITPRMLEDTANEYEHTYPSLCSKLRDIAIIYGTYDVLINEKYSDSADDLSKLCDILTDNDFFGDINVYIDSFTSFTAVEHRVIEHIFKSARNTTVSIPMSSPAHSDVSTAGIERSLKALKKSANKWGGHNDVILDSERKNYSPVLTYLSENIWAFEKNVEQEDKPSCAGLITMEICDNRYAEAEAAALHIRKLLSEGARCKDIVVVMRDASRYRGIIEPAFEKNDIPFFFSEKTDLCALAPVKFILTAVKIRQYSWRRNDVISHIKTGLCDFDERSSDIFEEYINTWNISGKRFTDSDWSMNPDGYTGRLTERGKHMLDISNSVRRKLCDSLERFFVMLDAAENVPDMCRALYSYIESVSLREKIYVLAQKELELGNKKAASELASSYDIILNSLAQLGEAMSCISVSVDEFYNLLKTVFEQTDIGTIPTSIDEVTVGSASLLRSQSPLYVFALGLCEGEFPATVDDSGIFAENDRITLEEIGLTLGSNNNVRSSDELMFIKNTFSSPRRSLYLFTYLFDANGSAKVPSLPFRRTQKLFSDLYPHRFNGNDLRYLCGSPQNTVAHLRNITKVSDRHAAIDAISEYIPSVAQLSTASASTDVCRVDPRTVKQLIGDKVYISPSSLERYVKCPFSYYAGYMLSLREQKKGIFAANNVGDFVHFIMENIIKFAIPTSPDDHIPSDAEIREKVESLVNEYVCLIVPDDTMKTKRMKHLYNKLKRLSLLITDNVIAEFSDSDFRPVFFELHIDGKDGNPAPLHLSLDNGASLILKGYIDRVDIWKHEGKTFVRIVDYKTGSKQFDLSDLEVGLNTQMLLYLFAVCRSSGTKLLTQLGSEQADVCPAGVVYLSSAFPKISLNAFDATEADILSAASEQLSRSGLIINDKSVIDAVSHSRSAELLMGITEKDGVLKGKALISSEAFESLYSDISKTLTDIGNSIYSGIADCAPMRSEDPCRYCKVYPVCRKINSDGRKR